jgi:hypothetical protein
MAVSLKENNCFFAMDQTPGPVAGNLLQLLNEGEKSAGFAATEPNFVFLLLLGPTQLQVAPLSSNQGDQIGRMFAYRAKFYFGHFLICEI